VTLFFLFKIFTRHVLINLWNYQIKFAMLISNLCTCCVVWYLFHVIIFFWGKQNSSIFTCDGMKCDDRKMITWNVMIRKHKYKKLFTWNHLLKFWSKWMKLNTWMKHEMKMNLITRWNSPCDESHHIHEKLWNGQNWH